MATRPRRTSATFMLIGSSETAEYSVMVLSTCEDVRAPDEPTGLVSNVAKRSALVHRPWMEQRLIVSNITTHTAEQLCDSSTSYGPDFVGTDGKYCDMGTKTLSPLCSAKNVDGCVEVSTSNKTVTKHSSVARRSVKMVHKLYETVSLWNL